MNSKYIHSSLAPWCLLAGIKEYYGGASVKVIEGTINEPLEEVIKRVSYEKPDIIGISCYIWNIKSVHILGEKLKELFPDLIIILGGPEVSYNAKEVLQNLPWCNYVISGEGEYPFAALCKDISEGKSISVPGVCFRNDENYLISEPYIGTGDPPSPYSEEYFSALKGRISYLETSRGCPYSCAFCLSGRCGGVRFFDIERAKREMLLLAQSGTQTVKLVDRTFNVNKSRAKEIWKFIISEHGKGIPENVCFHFEIAGDILDDEAIEILNSAPKGSMQLEIGLQSFNEKTLEYINRKTNTDKLRKNITKLIAPRNMHIHIDLIAGLPFEDIGSFANSFNIAYALSPDMLQLGFLKLLHGADMRELPERYPCEFSKEPPYEVISTEWTDESVLKGLHSVEDALERLYNSGRFYYTLEYLLSASGKTPFEIFDSFGKWVDKKVDYSVSLDDYTALVYEYFSTFCDINKSVLKDMMLMDRISSNASGKIPEILKVKNDNIKKIRFLIESEENYKRSAGIKRGFALLESENAAIFADYIDRDKITGRYKINKVYYRDIEVKYMDYKEKLKKLGVVVPNIILPNKKTDYSKYAVLACDQYAAQPDYWERVKNYVGDAPSTLHMTLPEAWLLTGDRDYGKRSDTMKKYLSDGTLEDIGEAMIFNHRYTPDGMRHGLIAAFDLEEYDYFPGGNNLIKVTEKTDLSRIIPRVEIRKNAAIELPHVLMLIVDKKDKLMQMLDGEWDKLEKVYDFDLMENGGRIIGAKIRETEILQKISDILEELFIENGGTFSFAIGDGNHSIATAKRYWDELKKTLSPEEQKNHPARYCLAEIINLYDPAMPYECMNRLLSGVKDTKEALKEMELDLENLPSLQELQPILDKWLENHPEASLEYIHDAPTCSKLGEEPGCIAFTYSEFDRDSVYEMIKNNSVFVRKSFAMGHPYEKRYYLEGRKIIK